MRRFYFSVSVAVLCMASMVIFAGCVGYVDDGGGAVVVGPPVPDVTVFGGVGGVYDPGHDVHVYSHRGYQSRQAVHYGHH